MDASKKIFEIGSTKNPDETLTEFTIGQGYNAEFMALYRIIGQRASDVISLLSDDSDRGFPCMNNGWSKGYELSDFKLLENWFERNHVRYHKAIITATGYEFLPDIYANDDTSVRCWVNMFTILGWHVKGRIRNLLLVESGAVQILAEVFGTVIRTDDPDHQLYLRGMIKAMKILHTESCIIIGSPDPDGMIGYSDTCKPITFVRDTAGVWTIRSGPNSSSSVPYKSNTAGVWTIRSGPEQVPDSKFREIWDNCLRATNLAIGPDPDSSDHTPVYLRPCCNPIEVKSNLIPDIIPDARGISYQDEEKMLTYVLQKYGNIGTYYPTSAELDEYIRRPISPGITLTVNAHGWAWNAENGLQHNTDDAPSYISGNRMNIIWTRFGARHRENDKPAVIKIHGKSVSWYKDGYPHRDGDKPARICTHGGVIVRWYRNGAMYRMVTSGRITNDDVIELLTNRMLDIISTPDGTDEKFLKPDSDRTLIRLFLIRVGVPEKHLERVMSAGTRENINISHLARIYTQAAVETVGNIELFRTKLNTLMIREAYSLE